MLLPEKFKEKFDIPKSKGYLQKALQLQLKYAWFYCMFMSAAIHGSTVGRRFIPSAEERRNKNGLSLSTSEKN
jgi:hypothetical protein